MKITLAHLYPQRMNTYGDSGNIRCLLQRAAWRGIDAEVAQVELGDVIPDKVHLYFFGGGQDTAQTSLGEDLRARLGERIAQDVAAGVPLLAICGGYQLLGKGYFPFAGDPILGTGLFPASTHASHDRMIGNILISPTKELELGEHNIVGFENHSGKTRLEPGAVPLGMVRQGFGNNGEDKTEGCVVHNAIGCYLHGPLLPKNPHVADWLLAKACALQDVSFQLKPLNDTLEWQAHDNMEKRIGIKSAA